MIAALLRAAAAAVRIGGCALGIHLEGRRLRARAVRAFRRELQSLGIDGKAAGVLSAKYAKLPKSWRNS
jgi:hypothetical protein